MIQCQVLISKWQAWQIFIPGPGSRNVCISLKTLLQGTAIVLLKIKGMLTFTDS